MAENGTGWELIDAAAPHDDDPAMRSLAIAFARCFGTRDGEAVLEHLTEIAQRRYCGPRSTDAALRHLEGQRHLVGYVLALIERGRQAP